MIQLDLSSYKVYSQKRLDLVSSFVILKTNFILFLSLRDYKTERHKRTQKDYRFLQLCVCYSYPLCWYEVSSSGRRERSGAEYKLIFFSFFPLLFVCYPLDHAFFLSFGNVFDGQSNQSLTIELVVFDLRLLKYQSEG